MGDEQLRTRFEILKRLKPTAVIFEHLRDEIVAAVTHRALQGVTKRNYQLTNSVLLTRILWACTRVAIVVALVVLVGGGTTFVAAQGAIPGQLLYPMKLVSERFAEAITYSAKGQLRMSIFSAQRRADELAVLKLRASTKSVTGKKEIAKAIISTSKRLTESSKKIETHLQHTRAISDKAGTHRVIPELQEKVDIFREVLKNVSQVSTEFPEVGEAVVGAQAQLESLDALISGDEPGVVKTEFDAIQILRAKIGRTIEQLPFKGILVPQELRGDLQIMENLMSEATRYEEYGKHTEAYGLVKSAQRLGDKILRQLGELERARLR